MSSGLRLRRPVFFAAGLRCPVCLRRIALCPVFLSVFRLSSRLPSFFPSSVFLLPARISHCPHFPLPVFLSARISPALSGRPPSSVFRLVFLLSFLVFPFIVHRPPLVVRRPLSIPCCPLPVTCRPLFIACCVARTPSPLSVPRRRAAPLSAAVRSGSRLLYPRNPGLRVCGSCLPCRSAAGSVGRSFRKNASALRTLVAAPFLTK